MSLDAIAALLRKLLLLWGPGGAPPEQVVQAVLWLLRHRAPGVLRALVQGDPDGDPRLCDVVVAFGLGWGRRDVSFSFSCGPAAQWDGVWDHARLWLEEEVRRCVVRTSRYLEFGLRIEGYAFRPHPELDSVSVQYLVRWLIQGGCPCPTLFATSPAGKRTKLRVARCLRDHVIPGWNPGASTLRDFVWQAVKGSKPCRGRHFGDFSPKALAQGMHYWNLYHECHLRLGDALVWICRFDGTQNFEGLPCLECLNKGRGAFLDPSAFRTTVSRLVVPQEWDGRYVQKAYWNCQHCRRLSYPEDRFFPGVHYYPGYLKACPKCDRPRTPGAKQSHVFLLAPRGVAQPWSEPGAEAVNGGEGSDVWSPDDRQGFQAPDPDRVELYAALTELEPRARRIIQLRFFGQRTLIETARAMRMPPDEARRLEAATLKQLRASMNALDEGEDA